MADWWLGLLLSLLGLAGLGFILMPGPRRTVQSAAEPQLPIQQPLPEPVVGQPAAHPRLGTHYTYRRKKTGGTGLA